MKTQPIPNTSQFAFSEKLRYAVSDLSHRRGTVVLTGFAISIGVAFFLTLAFYGQEFYRHQRDLVAGNALTHVTAVCEDISNPAARFTDDKVRELNTWPGVSLAFPKIEQGVVLSARDSARIQIAAEGTLPGDPRTAPAEMEWVPSGPPDSRPGVVLSRQVFQKLGGLLVGGRPQPDTLTLSVSRKKEGREQHLELPVAVAGLLRRQKSDRIYIPQEIAVRLDKYCSHKSDSIVENVDASRPPLVYAHGVAYVRPGSGPHLQEDARDLKLKLKPAGTVPVLVADQLPAWAVLRPAGTNALSLEDPPRLESLATGVRAFPELHQVLDTRAGRIKLVALAENDPRWESAPGKKPAPTGVLLDRNAGLTGNSVGTFPFQGQIQNGGQAIPIDAGLVCTHDTLAWLDFRLASTELVRIHSLLATESPATALQFARQSWQVESDTPVAWRLYDLPPQEDPESRERNSPLGTGAGAPPARVESVTNLMAINRSAPERTEPTTAAPRPSRVPGALLPPSNVNTGRVENASVLLGSTAPFAEATLMPARFLPDDFFRGLVPPARTSGSHRGIPCLLVGVLPPDFEPGALSVDGVPVRVVSAFPGRFQAGGELWFPAGARDRFHCRATGSAFAVWGEWQAVEDCDAWLATSKRVGAVLWRRDPTRYSVLVPAPMEEVLRYLDSTKGGLRRAVVQVAALGSEELGSVSGLSGLSHEEIEALVRRHGRMSRLVDQATFAQAVFQAAKERGQIRARYTVGCSVRLDSTLAYRIFGQRIVAMGFQLQPLSELREEVWSRYEFRDATAEAGRVNDDLVTVVEMTKPTFAAAFPCLELEGALGAKAFAVLASSPTDPLQFAQRLVAGNWLATDREAEIVLPEREAVLLAGAEPKVGLMVPVIFKRIDPVTRQPERLTLALRLVGLSEGSQAYVPLGLAKNLALWGQNKCLFNVTRGIFETPLELYERRGHVRCNIVTSNAVAVESLVRRLESLSYRTESSLTDLANLRQFKWSMILFIVCVSVGALLNAAITVLATAAVYIRTKSWEIGLLKALSLSQRNIMEIFLLQGVLIGVLGFGISLVLAGVAEPLLIRNGMTAVFGNGVSDIIHGSVFSPQNSLLVMVGLLVAVGFSLLGILLPARTASRMSPIMALSRRE